MSLSQYNLFPSIHQFLRLTSSCMTRYSPFILLLKNSFLYFFAGKWSAGICSDIDNLSKPVVVTFFSCVSSYRFSFLSCGKWLVYLFLWCSLFRNEFRISCTIFGFLILQVEHVSEILVKHGLDPVVDSASVILDPVAEPSDFCCRKIATKVGVLSAGHVCNLQLTWYIELKVLSLECGLRWAMIKAWSL